MESERTRLKDGIRYGSTRGVPFVIRRESGEFHNLLDTESPHPLQRAIMPIVIRRGNVYEVAGTAFAISYEIFLTAAHVVADQGRARMEEAQLLYVGGRNPDGNFMGGFLPVVKVQLYAACDIALLWARFPLSDDSELALSLLPISFQPPKVGDACVALGYTAGLTFDVDAVGTDRMTLAPKLNASTGAVEDVFLKSRDTSLMRFPCYQVSARFDAQMSGSPVLSGGVGQQRVTGVVATGWEHSEPGMQTGFASLLWPAAGLRMEMQDEDATLREISVLEMAQRSRVAATGTELVSFEGGIVRLRIPET